MANLNAEQRGSLEIADLVTDAMESVLFMFAGSLLSGIGSTFRDFFSLVF